MNKTAERPIRTIDVTMQDAADPVKIVNYAIASFTPRGNTSATIMISFEKPINGFPGAYLNFTDHKPLLQNYIQDNILHIFLPLETLAAMNEFLRQFVVANSPANSTATFYFNPADLQGSVVIKQQGY